RNRAGEFCHDRNSRLAALRSFAQHLLRHDIARADQYGRILAIPSKRAAARVVSYLEPEEARAIIAAVEERTPFAARDRALLLFLNARGAPLTRDGVAFLLGKYVRRASETRSSLQGRHVTPHMMRHGAR